MNHLLIGNADKTERLLEITKGPFLLIDDGPVADAFLAQFPDATVFNPRFNSFNPLDGMDYKRARDFASLLYSISPQGENTLTVRNGRRALVRLLLMGPVRLCDLPEPSETNDDTEKEALGMVQELLLSPVLTRVLCRTRRTVPFCFEGQVVAKLDRAQLGDFDALVLASLLTGQHKGQIIVPDFGFYGCAFHTSLIRQNRLTAGLRRLSEISSDLREEMLDIPHKTIFRVSRHDAEALIDYVDSRKNPSILFDQDGNAYQTVGEFVGSQRA